MQTTLQALACGGWEAEEGYFKKQITDDIEICLEPLIFDEQFYLAVYKDKSLMFPKVVMKPGYIKDE